jgi:amidase
VTRKFARFFSDYDIWLTPTTADPPPPLGHLHADVDDVDEFFHRLWRFNPIQWVYNATGNPAITLSLYWNATGLPLGVMLGARFWSRNDVVPSVLAIGSGCTVAASASTGVRLEL